MGRRKVYKTEKAFEKAIEKYFDSISRTVPVVVKDENGMPQKIRNDKGDFITKREFIIPPTISALCIFLGISRQTFNSYSDPDKNPEFAEIIADVKLRIASYLEEQLCTRSKGVQGIIFNLQNNYGWSEKKELELGEQTRKSALDGLTASDKLRILTEVCENLNAPQESK